MIVSFQNCGQQGTVALELQSQSKVANNDLVDISDDVGNDGSGDVSGGGSDGSGVKQPPKVNPPLVNPPKYPPIVGEDDPPVTTQPHDPKEDEDEDDDMDIVDSDDDGNVKGPNVSCADLLRRKIPSIGGLNNGSSSYKNTKHLLVVNGQESLSIENHRGVMLLSNIGIINSISNVRSIFSSIRAKSIESMENVRALSLIDAQQFKSLKNYRGLSCVAAQVGDIENYRGILEIKGNVNSIKNFRGILKVDGKIGSLENFRGILLVNGEVIKKVDVKVRLK